MINTLVLCCLFFLFTCASNAGTNNGFLVDCNKLDTMLNIGEYAAKFDRINGDYIFDAKSVDLAKYGFPISIPMPNDKKLENITHADIKIRFIPKDSTSNLSSDSILKVHPYKIKSRARNDLKKILSKSIFEKYKGINLFDFLIRSLGKEKSQFNCDSEARAVAMFMSSYVKPYDHDGVSVYNLTKLNAMLLVSKDKHFGLIEFIYANDIDTLIRISIEGSPKALANYLNLLKKLPRINY